MDVSYYLQRRFTDPTDKERGAQPFYLKSIHDFYQNFGRFLNRDTARLLEYGGGPVIYPLISASPFFNEITFCDYQRSSLDAVIAWKNDQEGHHDWTPYFNYVITELERCKVIEETVLSRQNGVKKKLEQFSIGDLRANDVVVDKFQEKLIGKFDVVSSHFCCDAVAKTIEEYQSFVQKLSKYVMPGGFIISLVSLEESYWYTSYSDERTACLYLTESDVKKAYEMAGFSIVHSVVHNLPESARNILNDCKANMFVVGQKK